MVGYGLLLPPAAVLYARSADARRSGAVLGVLAGAATAVSGAIGTPATVFFQALWWWTIGKTARETGMVDRRFAMLTMVLAALTFVAALFAAIGSFAAPVLAESALGVWLFLLGAVFLKEEK